MFLSEPSDQVQRCRIVLRLKTSLKRRKVSKDGIRENLGDGRLANISWFSDAAFQFENIEECSWEGGELILF
jgi:hypothetical protein